MLLETMKQTAQHGKDEPYAEKERKKQSAPKRE